MPDALIVCPETPYPVAGGGPLRTACLLEYLASRYALDVVIFHEPGTPDPHVHFPAALARSVHVVELPYHSKTPIARAWRNLHRLTRGVPPLVDRFAGFSLPGNCQYDLAVIEHFWCAPYIYDLRPFCRRLALNLHNVESVLLQRCGDTEGTAERLAFRRFSAACRELEHKLLPLFDLVLVTSEADRAFAEGGVVWPNTLPETKRPEAPRRAEIVFSGNMAYHPNAAAVHYFAADIWPRIRVERPDLVWRLVGKNPEALRLPTDVNIACTGAIDDAIGTLAGASAAVAPLLSGSGTRFKILEAWAAGVPVVSTTIGAEGLEAEPGKHLLLADTPDSFAGAVLSVVNDYALAERLAKAGRLQFEAKYTWPIAWKMLEAAGL